MFGNQSSPRESTSEFRSFCSKPNIAHHGVDETQAGARPVYGCYYRLRDREGVVMSLSS